MPATAATDTATYPYRPSDDSVGWVERNLKWENITPGELRCLWVIERYLAESGHRFYHLSEPFMKRIGGGGIVTTTFGTIDSYDSAGLAALTVAAFAAAVRVDIRTETLYYDPTREEPRLHWAQGDVKPACWTVGYRVVVDLNGRAVEPSSCRLLTERFDTEEERDAHVEFLRSVRSADGRVRYSVTATGCDPDGGMGEDVGRSTVLAVMLHPREHDDVRPGMRFFERHPGVTYLRDMIDRLALPTGRVSDPERSWDDLVESAAATLLANGPKYPETGQPRPTCVVVRGCPQDVLDRVNRGEALRYSAYRFAGSDDDVRPHEVHITYGSNPS